MKDKIPDFQNKTLKLLTKKIDDFYLAGGTALSLYYFHHRQSFDLDFFTRDFNRVRISQIINYLANSLNKKIELVAEESRRSRIRISVYTIIFNKAQSLKLDFVQDYIGCIKPPRYINGINVLSLEDIYIRKIYAVSGTSPQEDSIGKRITKAGRQEAKDLYDLYCLSQIFMRLSDFSFSFANQLLREGIIRWFRTYDRMDMKTGLLELRLHKHIDYSEIERHFKKEIDRIIEKEVESI